MALQARSSLRAAADFGLALIIGASRATITARPGLPYAMPIAARRTEPRFMFLPNYRAWVIVMSLAVCLSTWFVIELRGSALFARRHGKSDAGARLRHHVRADTLTYASASRSPLAA